MTDKLHDLKWSAKGMIALVAILVLWPLALVARPLEFEWDADPGDVAGYRIYIRAYDSTGEPMEWQPKAATSDLHFSADDWPGGLFDVGVASFVLLTNSNDPTPGSGGDLESGIISLPMPPTPAGSERLRLVTEKTTDFREWTPIASQVIVTDPDEGRAFFRTRIEPTE